MVIHVRLGIWVVGIVLMVVNHGLAPRNVLEAKSIWSKGLGLKSDEVQHNSGLELCQSWSGATGVTSEAEQSDQSCIRDTLEILEFRVQGN